MGGLDFLEELKSQHPDDWQRFITGRNLFFSFYLHGVEVLLFRNNADIFCMQCAHPEDEYKVRDLIRTINVALSDTRQQIDEADLEYIMSGFDQQKPVRVI